MKIIDVFEKKTINQISVLEHIYENSGIVNIEKISKKTLLDSKTISIVVQDIFDQINNNLDLSKIDDYLAVRSNLFQESWVYKLLYRLFLVKEVSIISFTIEVYISESKLRRKIKSINEMLKPVSIKIISKNGYIDIKGSEIQIRFLAQQFFWTIFKGGEWPFKEVDFNRTYKLFYEYVFNNKDIFIKNITYVEWSYTFAINVIRFRHGREILEEDIKKFNYLYSTEYMNDKYIRKICQILKTDYYFSTEEQHYLFILIQAKAQFYMNNIFLNKSIQVHKKVNSEIYIVYQEVLCHFNKNKISEQMALGVILSANISASLIHGFSHTHSGYGVPDLFTKYAPHLIPKMEEIVNKVKKKYPTISFLNQSTYLSVRYAEAYALVSDMTDFEKKVIVVLMTDLPFATEELMVRKLKATFYMRANVEFRTFIDSEFKEYDLIIKTTVTVNKKIYDERVIVINSSLSDKDMQKIGERIRGITKKVE